MVRRDQARPVSGRNNQISKNQKAWTRHDFHRYARQALRLDGGSPGTDARIDHLRAEWCHVNVPKVAYAFAEPVPFVWLEMLEVLKKIYASTENVADRRRHLMDPTASLRLEAASPSPPD